MRTDAALKRIYCKITNFIIYYLLYPYFFVTFAKDCKAYTQT